MSLRFRHRHGRLLAKRRAAPEGFFLSDSDFRFAADCERMRVDRNGSVLSLLLIRPATTTAGAAVENLGRVLEDRLRVTDTPGLLQDGRIGVLLPDTPEQGAWKVASDVSEVFPPGPDRPECEVLVYPPHGRRPSGNEEAKVRTASETLDQSIESYLAKKMPAWKRAFDMAGAALGLALSAPIMAVAAAAIRCTSPGPVFFVQEREGLGGRRFNIWKLRTMCVDAEEKKFALRTLSTQDGPAFKMHPDPRTTKIGRFLRRASIDELPQFWNVLKGDMSLVGPRPLPTEESQACEGWQRQRLNVTPGMTCTWQIKSRGMVRFDEWTRMDLRYARERSLWRDLKLVILTIPSLVRPAGPR